MCVQYVRVLNINIESIVYCIRIMYFIHGSLHIVQKPITFLQAKVCAYIYTCIKILKSVRYAYNS